jgi:hypothetical protein
VIDTSLPQKINLVLVHVRLRIHGSVNFDTIEGVIVYRESVELEQQIVWLIVVDEDLISRLDALLSSNSENFTIQLLRELGAVGVIAEVNERDHVGLLRAINDSLNTVRPDGTKRPLIQLERVDALVEDCRELLEELVE